MGNISTLQCSHEYNEIYSRRPTVAEWGMSPIAGLLKSLQNDQMPWMAVGGGTQPYQRLGGCGAPWTAVGRRRRRGDASHGIRGRGAKGRFGESAEMHTRPSLSLSETRTREPPSLEKRPHTTISILFHTREKVGKAKGGPGMHAISFAPRKSWQDHLTIHN